MKIFQLIRKPLRYVGIYPAQISEKGPFNWKNILIILLFGQFIILSLAFILFEANDLIVFTEAFYIFSTSFLSAFILFELIRKIFSTITSFEVLIGTRLENPISATIFANVNERVEKWTELLHLVLVKLSTPGVMVPKFIISFYLYIWTDLGGDAFSLPYPAWFPFDWRTPYGYLIAYAIEFAVSYYVVCIAACHLSFFIGSHEILIAFAMELEQDFHQLIQKPDENLAELKKKLSEFVQFHCSAKQRIEEFGDVYKLIIAILAIWSISTICSTLLLVEMEIANNTANLMGLIQPLTMMFWSFVVMFIYCDFGERISCGFEAVHNGIEECNWYLFSIEMQKMLLIIMAADEPVVLKGFANVVMTRETFNTIASGGYSYFTVLSQFTE